MLLEAVNRGTVLREYGQGPSPSPPPCVLPTFSDKRSAFLCSFHIWYSITYISVEHWSIRVISYSLSNVFYTKVF